MSELSDFDKKILLVLKGNLMSISELSKRLEFDRMFVKGILESMRYRGLLGKEIVGRINVYRLSEEAEELLK